MTIAEQARVYGCAITIDIDPSTPEICIFLTKGAYSATYNFPDNVCLSYDSINTCIKNFAKTIEEVGQIKGAYWVVKEGWSIKEGGSIEGVTCSACGYTHPIIYRSLSNLLPACPGCGRIMKKN